VTLAPSRHSNPFATCWTRPGAVEYVALDAATPELLSQRLAASDWWGEIVGPHGAGKTTLLATLEPHVKALGRQWVQVGVHPRGKRDAWRTLRAVRLGRRAVLVVDGFEQLATAARWWVRRRCRAAGSGLLVTTHRPLALPRLVTLEPQEQLGREVFCHLQQRVPTPVTEADFRDAFNACNGNLREVFFELYDLHERRIRNADAANRPRR